MLIKFIRDVYTRFLLFSFLHLEHVQVVPDVLKVDAEHEALCREAIVQARLLACDDNREVLSISSSSTPYPVCSERLSPATELCQTDRQRNKHLSRTHHSIHIRTAHIHVHWNILMVTYINASGQTHASDEYIHTYVLTHSLTHT